MAVKIAKENSAYVYAYVDTIKQKMRYVGKGTGKRDIAHLNSVDDYLFQRGLRKMLREGNEPLIVRLLENVSDEEAFAYEDETIERVGKVIDGTGPLWNIANGGRGSMKGRKHSQESKDKTSKANMGTAFQMKQERR